MELMRQQQQQHNGEEKRHSQGGLDMADKRRLETRVKELMSEVQQERHERSAAEERRRELADEMERERGKTLEADARSRQLASELFQIKSAAKQPNLATPGGGGCDDEPAMSRSSDARSEQLASELFHIKSATMSSMMTKQPNLATPGVGGCDDDEPATSRGSDATTASVVMDSNDATNPQRVAFALKFCCSLNKTYVNATSGDLQHVLGTASEVNSANNAMASLNTAVGQRLSLVATELRGHSNDDALSSVPGALWEKDKDYTIIDDKPVDSRLRRNEDGSTREVIFRILRQSKMANMKV